MGCSYKQKLISLCCTGWILAIIGAVMVPLVHYIVRKKVEQSVQLVEGSTMYPMWRDIPIPIYMQFYMFNVTNHREVLLGAIPRVEQFGPYTYREKRIKYDIIHNSNGTVTYRQNRTFHFVSDMSKGSESDIFITPNPVYWSLISAIKRVPESVRKIINFVTKFEEESVFMQHTMNETVWGYQDKMLHLAKGFDPTWFYTDTIGYFMNKNDTNDGVYTIFTGETDINLLGGIDQYNGTRFLNFWTTKYANMINGSDGTVSPPFRGKSASSPMFASDICRSIQGEYSGDVFIKDNIRLWRHTAPLDYMANATVNPDNIGFCTPQSNCLNTGMLNISTCQTVDFFHIPIGISFPHFYLAAEEFKNSVSGLHPVAEEHQTAVDVEPYTGLTLQAAKRLQINLYIQPIEDITATKQLRKTFVPVFWINESAVVDDANAEKLKSMLFTPLEVVQILEVALISLGCLVLLCTVIYLLCVNFRGNQSSSVTANYQKHRLECCAWGRDGKDKNTLIGSEDDG